MRFRRFLSSRGEEDQRRAVSGSVDCAVVVEPNVVQTNGEPLSRGSPDVAARSGCPLESRCSCPDGSGDACADSLAAVGRRFQTHGLPPKSADLAARGWRRSTHISYFKRWVDLLTWCSQKEICASNASVSVVAEFLTTLFDSGLDSCTIQGYKSAILFYHLRGSGVPDVKNSDLR